MNPRTGFNKAEDVTYREASQIQLGRCKGLKKCICIINHKKCIDFEPSSWKIVPQFTTAKRSSKEGC